MEIAVSFRHGPLECEFRGEDREAVQEDLEGFIEFLDENSELLQGITPPQMETDDRSERSGLEALEQETEEVDGNGTDSGSECSEGIERVAERLHRDASEIDQAVEVPVNEESVPRIKTLMFEEGAEVLGKARYSQQARAGLILLYLWKEVAGIDGVSMEKFTSALTDSEIDPSRPDNMYNAFDGDADKYFDKPGRGGEISLTAKGEHKAKQEFRQLIDELD